MALSSATSVARNGHLHVRVIVIYGPKEILVRRAQEVVDRVALAKLHNVEKVIGGYRGWFRCEMYSMFWILYA